MTSTEYILPPEQLYWTVLDMHAAGGSAHGVKSARIRRRMGYAFERVLPVPVESVHAVYVPLSNKRVLACGIDRQRLESLLSEGALVIRPSKIPDWIEAQVELDLLNLARFEATPPVLLRQRTRLAATCSILLTVILLFAAVGMHRRASANQTVVGQMNQQTDALILASMGPSASGQIPRLRLVGELRRLRSLSASAQRYTGAADAVLVLIDALEYWPDTPTAQTESLVASGSHIRLRTRHADQQHADEFASQWKPQVSNWTLRQPGMTTHRDSVLLELVAERRLVP